MYLIETNTKRYINKYAPNERKREISQKRIK